MQSRLLILSALAHSNGADMRRLPCGSHRGKMQFRPYRTAVWAKDGLKDRARAVKDKITNTHRHEETVATEGS